MAKSKKTETGRYKVYAFMVNPHTLIMVSEDGKKLAQIEVADATAGKEKLVNEQLNQDIIMQIKRFYFSTIWVDDPAGDPDVIEACKKMEQQEAKVSKDETTALEVDAAGAPEGAPVLAPQIEEVHTWGMVFQTQHDGTWMNIPGTLLKKSDVCRFFPYRENPDEKEWVLTADPELVTQEPSDYLIKVIPKGTVLPEEPLADAPAEPQFKTTEKTKMVDVECPTTRSEEKIKQLVRGLQSLKAEAQADAADWRERIKTQEKALFEACNGKSFTQMECRIEEDWDAGVRRYIRPDTGEIALEEQIPYEERQLHMDIPPATDQAAEANADGQAPTEGTTPETKPASSETVEEDAGDFPPPEETTEPVEETAAQA